MNCLKGSGIQANCKKRKLWFVLAQSFALCCGVSKRNFLQPGPLCGFQIAYRGDFFLEKEGNRPISVRSFKPSKNPNIVRRQNLYSDCIEHQKYSKMAYCVKLPTQRCFRKST